MRGKLAKKLRRAAKEMSGSGWADRALAELNGTRRRKTIKDVEVIPNGEPPKELENGTKTLDTTRPRRADISLETFTVINHPASVRGRYRLLKRAYKNARRDHG